MKSQRGFTLIEAMLGMMVLLTAASFIAPVFTKDLILGRVMWEHRLAVKFIETKLDEACNAVKTSANFNALNNASPTAIANPPELFAANATWTQTVACLNASLGVVACPTDLKQVQVSVDWTSGGHPAVKEQSADYLISRSGVCGTGAGA